MNGQSVVTVSTTASVSWSSPGTDSTRAITGSVADGKKFERRLHESKPPFGRDPLAIVGGLAREQPLGEGGYEGGGIGGKIPVD